jgi:hypothetical protein|tara:strand:- start:289 stop:549 length:261 start_codon:yes stop_codon:yes gene_type:complete
MALTKEISYDYEIRGVGNNIQQRQKTTILEDGVRLNESYNRVIYTIGDSLDGINDETTVKSLSSSLWTPEVSASYALLQTSQSLGL